MSVTDAIAFASLMLGFICVSGIWLDAYKRRLTNRERELELKAQIAEAQAGQDAAGKSALEERLRVLERIATDKPTTLAAQIEGLREPVN